mmetsp:Transcript_10143/g.10108  ORF Transcript_10143/g.10108 Transcript_10143/m.10108 type:complete len:116 (+) Transcript_10143:210-557(+)
MRSVSKSKSAKKYKSSRHATEEEKSLGSSQIVRRTHKENLNHSKEKSPERSFRSTASRDDKHKPFAYRNTNHSPLRAEYNTASGKEDLYQSRTINSQSKRDQSNYLSQSSYMKET